MKLILNSILTLSTSITVYLLSYWFVQPNIEYFNDGYLQRVNDKSFGTIYLINNGRGADEDITITFGMHIPKENITVLFLTVPVEVIDINQHTAIRIPKLNPGEDAEITFETEQIMETFTIDNFTSKSGNINEVSDILLPWWNLSTFQIKIFGSILVLFTSIGLYIGTKMPYSSLGNRKKYGRKK